MQLARPARGAIASDDDPARDRDDAPFGDEAELVARAQRDLAAFAPLYERYAPVIHLYCLRRIGDREDAADATTLVFTRALGALGRYRPDPKRPGSTFRAWLFTIARNVVLDRRRRWRPHLSLDAPETDWHLADPGESPEARAIRAEEARSVAAMLRQLPERQRAVVELRLAGLTIAEIASALDLTESAAKSHQARAYRALRELVVREDSPISLEDGR